MPTTYQSVAKSIDVSFDVYNPQGELIFSETNEWTISQYNENAQIAIFKTNENSGAVISADQKSYFVSFGDFSFTLSPLYHGATVSGVTSRHSGSVSCSIKHNLQLGSVPSCIIYAAYTLHKKCPYK